MRLLVVSHSCVTPINQQIYAEIRKLTGWDITLLLPDTWKDEFGNTLRATKCQGFEASLVKTPVHPNGNIIFHVYGLNLRRFLSQGQFEAIYVNHEPYGLSTAQLCWANNRYSRFTFWFYYCQNIR
jgi:hypothetical protein